MILAACPPDLRQNPSRRTSRLGRGRRWGACPHSACTLLRPCKERQHHHRYQGDDDESQREPRGDEIERAENRDHEPHPDVVQPVPPLAEGDSEYEYPEAPEQEHRSYRSARIQNAEQKQGQRQQHSDDESHPKL